METKDPITRLREELEACGCDPDNCMRCSVPRKVKKALGEIEAKYMKLPVDADGLPVSIGDKLTRHKTNGKVYEVEELRYDGETWWFESGEGCFSCDSASHVKHDTVESLLEEFAVKYEQVNNAPLPKVGFGNEIIGEEELSDVIADYAERIRKAVEDDQ